MNQDDDTTLTFSKAQLTVLNAALQESPFKHAAPLINDINRQINDQRAAEQAMANEPPAPTLQ